MTTKPTAAFVGPSWTALLIGLTAFAVGLWNATMLPSEKGFYGLAFAMTLFAAVAVQKNVRDSVRARRVPAYEPPPAGMMHQ